MMLKLIKILDLKIWKELCSFLKIILRIQSLN
nr:MAG TPA: hypothetical protein [Caudoviricetes sp.]